MERIGSVLVFKEPEACPEIPYPARSKNTSDAEADRIEHNTSWSARTSAEPGGYMTR